MKNLNIATFDSGFGGFFTAKEIEKVAREMEKKYDVNIYVQHYGDTKNAPYGEKTPNQIADLTTAGVKFAFDNTANMVFIACNTASTQYTNVRRNIELSNHSLGKDVVSIIDKTAEHVRDISVKALANENEIHIGILSTPATLKSGAYIEKLSELLRGKLSKGNIKSFNQERWNKEAGTEIESNKQESVIELQDGKKVHIYHVGPGIWVDLIEKSGSEKDKKEAVERDVGILMSMIPKNSKLIAVGEFCTHYPVFDKYIKDTTQKYDKSTPDTEFVKQGAIMAKEFEERFQHLKLRLRPKPLEASGVFANIFITGDNIDATKKLASDLFPSKRETQVQKIEFGKTRDLGRERA